MADVKDLIAALRNPSEVLGRNIRYSRIEYLSPEIIEGVPVTYACAYGIGSILLGRDRYEDFMNGGDWVDDLHEFVNEGFGLDEDTGKLMEKFSDTEGWSAAADLLERTLESETV